jgi:Glycosyl-transferase for dystroglycan
VIVTHCRVLRMDLLILQADLLGGPMSAAIHLNCLEDVKNLHLFALSHRQETANMILHIIMELAKVRGYPHNLLCNLALDSITTDYVLAMDADFITNPDAHNKLVHLIQKNANIYEKLWSKYLIALPPFQVFPKTGNNLTNADLLLRSKDNVLEQVGTQTIIEFSNKDYNPNSGEFHSYDKWYLGDQSLVTFP